MLKGSTLVSNEMDTLSAMSDQIANSMNEMSEGTTEINKAVYEVNEITQKNKQSIEIPLIGDKKIQGRIVRKKGEKQWSDLQN